MIGGFTRDKKRTNSIEVFIEKSKSWAFVGPILPFEIEASIVLPMLDDIFLLGGRQTHIGDTNVKIKFNFRNGDLSKIEQVGEKLAFKECLHNIFHVNKHFFVFGSTNKNIDFLK